MTEVVSLTQGTEIVSKASEKELPKLKNEATAPALVADLAHSTVQTKMFSQDSPDSSASPGSPGSPEQIEPKKEAKELKDLKDKIDQIDQNQQNPVKNLQFNNKPSNLDSEPNSKSEDQRPESNSSKNDGSLSSNATHKVSKTDMDEYRSIASKLFNEEFLLINVKEYMQFLASLDRECFIIRELYMDLFQWDKDLLKSTRMLCRKLQLKGESQEIDRILSSFTRSYLKRHSDNVFCTVDFEKIYIIIYSLILLNTNLHNSEVGKKSRISQLDYIRNTLDTFLQEKRDLAPLSVKQRIQIEQELSSFYEDLSKEQFYFKTGDQTTNKRLSINPKRFSVADTIFSSSSTANVVPGHGLMPLNGHTDGNSPAISQTDSLKFSNFDLPLPGSIASYGVAVPLRKPVLQVSKETVPGSYISNPIPNPRKTSHGGFGFTRALVSEAAVQRALAASSLRTVQNDTQLNHWSLRASLLTKDSRASMDYADDLFSMASIDALEVSLSIYDQTQGFDQSSFDIKEFQDPVDLKLELQGAPYLKEGLLKLQILNDDHVNDHDSAGANVSISTLDMSIGSQKTGMFSFLRSFATSKPKTVPVNTVNNLFSRPLEYFVVVSKGELRLYSFDPKIVKKHRKRQQSHSLHSSNNADLGDGNWLKNAANVGNYNLCSTYAKLERTLTSMSGKKPLWTLVFPKVSKKPQKLLVFEAGTVEVATEFVNTCNFWASKITAVPPLEEAISSIEYGWTDLESLERSREGFKRTKMISKWEQLPRGVYFSNFGLSNGESTTTQQYEGVMMHFLKTLKYYYHLKGLYMQFSRQKVKFVKNFRRYAGSSNYTLILNNYEQKSQEYKSDLTRYKSYIVMLAYGLKLRHNLEEREEPLDDSIDALKGDDESSQMLNRDNSSCINDVADKTTALKDVVERDINKLLMTSGELQRLVASDPNYKSEVKSQNRDIGGSVKKSPKTFSLSLFDFEASPIKQLLSMDASPAEISAEIDMGMTRSTTTIEEEDEPEDEPSVLAS